MNRAWAAEALAAFDAAKRGDMKAAANAVETIATRHGGNVIPEVMLAWIDTTICEIGGTRMDVAVRLAFMDTADPDRIIRTADDMHPMVVWAGRLAVARLTDDQAMFTALIESIHTDEEWGRAVLTLLMCCADTARHGVIVPPGQ